MSRDKCEIAPNMKVRRVNRWNHHYLFRFLLDIFEYRFKGGVREAGVVSRLYVSLIAARESLRPKVEGVAEGFMDALKIFPGHEHLGEVSRGGLGTWSLEHARSKAVEQARGWVATKMGLLDMMIQLLYYVVQPDIGDV